MNDERLEPSVDHEYILAFSLVTSESGAAQLRVQVITTREFTAFAYTLGITTSLDISRARLRIELGGLSIPSVMMPAAKGAHGEQAVAMPPDGEYQVEVTRRSSTHRALLTVLRGRPTAVRTDDEGGFARFLIAETAEE